MSSFVFVRRLLTSQIHLYRNARFTSIVTNDAIFVPSSHRESPSIYSASNPFKYPPTCRCYAVGGTGGSVNQGSSGNGWLVALGVSALVGGTLGFRWYINRKPDYEQLKRQTGVKPERIQADYLSFPPPSAPIELNQETELSASSENVSKESLSENIVSPRIPTNAETDENMETKMDNSEFDPLKYKEEERVGFPRHVRYLIVGAGTAGISAARAIRASDPTSGILMVAGDVLAQREFECTDPGIEENNFVEPPPYLRPPLSKELWRRTKERETKLLVADGDIRKHSWVYYESESFFVKPEELNALPYGGVALLRGDPVQSLDPDRQSIRLSSGRQIFFDQCLLATGGKPKRLSEMEHCSSTGTDLVKAGYVSYFRTLDDYKRLRSIRDKLRACGGRMAVIGGGFLGSELTVSLLSEPSIGNVESDKTPVSSQSDSGKADKSLSVLHILRESAPLGHVLPPCLASATARYEASRGAELWSSSELVDISLVSDSSTVKRQQSAISSPFYDHPSPLKSLRQPVTMVEASGSQSSRPNQLSHSATDSPRVRLRLRSGDSGANRVTEIDVDHIVCAVGIEANTALAEGAGLEIDPVHGGFLVNAELEARSGVYAAGDCASYWDPVIGIRRRVEHLNFAEEAGVLAGKNMAASFIPLPAGEWKFHDEALSTPSSYHHQSSLWSSLSPNFTWDAVGLIDSKRLDTRSFFAPTARSNSEEVSNISRITVPDNESGRLGRGVVFYLTPKERKLVGILLWNLADDLYTDNEFPAPSRLHLARSILAAQPRMVTGESDVSEQEKLRQLACQFDLFGELQEDYDKLKAYADAKMKEMSEQIEENSSKDSST